MLWTDGLYGIVFLVFFVCLFLTRRLRCDDPALVDPKANVTSTGAGFAGVWAFTIFLMTMYLRPLQPLVVSLLMIALALHARALDDQRMAARGLMGDAVYLVAFPLSMLGIAMPSLGHLPTPHAFWTTPAYVSLTLALITQKGWTYRLNTSSLRKRLATAGWIVFLAGSLIAAINATAYGSETQLRAFVIDFDDGVAQVGDWEKFGVTQMWLRASGNAPEITNRNERIRKALNDGTHIHPRTLKGAMDAGLMDDAMWAAYRADWGANERRFLLSEPLRTFIWTQSKPLELRAFLRDPQTTAEERRTIIGRVANSWPIERGIGNLEEAREIADLLAELGRKDLVLEERGGLHELLERSWCREAAWHTTPGGFSAYNEGCPDGSSSRDATLDAVRLMVHVGVPAGVDLVTLDRHLQTSLRPSVMLRPFEVDSRDVETIVARRLLHHHFGEAVATRSSPWRYLPLAAWLLPGLFGLILLLRAPNVEIRLVEDVETNEDAGEANDD